MADVNVPTDNRIKEQDVNRKLQLYGIYSAFAEGKVPSNKQIDIALNSAMSSKALSSPSNQLSKEGQALVADLKEVIRQAKYLLLSKNEGNLIQEFIWDCQDLDGGNASIPNAPTDKETARQHGNETLENLKILGRLILSNGQFRKLLKDAGVLARDIAGDAAQTAADKVNPDKSQLDQIDKPAADDQWHDVPSRQEIKDQASSTINKNKPFSREEAKQVAQDSADQAQRQPTDSNREAGKAGAQDAAGTLMERAKQNVPDETQDNIREAKDTTVRNTKNYMSKKMPQERRDQTLWRLKKMLVEIQGHEDYRDAIDSLISLAETYGGHAKSIANQSGGAASAAHDDDSLRSAEGNLKTLIERFANSTSADDLFEALNNIYRDADQDPELKDWFKRLDRFIRKCLQEQGYVLQDSSTEEWNQLYDKGQYLTQERYRDHFDRVLDEIKFLGDQFDQDPQNKKFGDAVQKLFLDLGNDENGQAQFKPWLVKDLVEVIIPGIFQNTRYVPIPRIEVSDPMVDVVVENLVLESDNLFPNQFEFAQDNYFRMGRKDKSSKVDNRVMISATGIQTDLRDVAYYVKRKQGFPSITDKGVMDIIMAGEGFSFKLAARNAQKSDRTHFIAIDTVDVTIHDLQIRVKESNHKLLFKIAKGLLLKAMRPVITKIIEKQIKDNFEKADAWLYGIYKEANKAIEAAKDDPENAPNMYQQYVNAIQRSFDQKKKKAEQKASETKINVAITKEDSMFKHISLPGGISTKATEYKKLAQKGDRWESPIFTWGDAKESTDIPKLTAVQRKPHKTASGEVLERGQGRSSGGYGSTGGAGDYGSTGGSGSFGPSGTTGDYGSGASGYGSGTGGPQYATSGGGLATRAAPALGGSSGQYGSVPPGSSVGTAATNMSATSGQGLSAPAAGLERQMEQALNPHHQSGTGTGGAATGGSGIYYDNVTR